MKHTSREPHHLPQFIINLNNPLQHPHHNKCHRRELRLHQVLASHLLLVQVLLHTVEHKVINNIVIRSCLRD